MSHSETGALPGKIYGLEIAAAEGPGAMAHLREASRSCPPLAHDAVLLRVAAAGVNRGDLLQRQGLYPPPPGASDLPGLEVSGTVVAAGPGVQTWQPGDQACALLAGGGYADHVAAAADHLLPLPAGISLEDAAALPEAACTVWHNLVERGRLQAGETCLIHGGTSGIGVLGIQIAAALGARVFATAGTPDKCRAAEALGAERCVHYRSADFVAEIQAATGGRGADVILDMVGGDYVARNLSLLARDGRLVNIAFQQGAKAELDLLPLMLRRLTVTGSTLRARDHGFKTRLIAAVRRHVWPLIAEGRVRPVIDRRFPLKEAEAAHRHMETGGPTGKILLVL